MNNIWQGRKTSFWINDCGQRLWVFTKKNPTIDPRTNAWIKVWGTPTLVEVNNLYANATSFLVPRTMFNIKHCWNKWWLWTIASPNENIGLSLGEQFEQWTRALLIRQDQCIEILLANMFKVHCLFANSKHHSDYLHGYDHYTTTKCGCNSLVPVH